MKPPRTRNWKAYKDTMPGSAHNLRVLGQVELPNPGYTAVLSKLEPGSINPSVLILALTLSPGSNITTEVLTWKDVSYVEKDGVETEVTINYGGQLVVELEVEIVS